MKVMSIRSHKYQALTILLYVCTLFITGLIVSEIKTLTGVSLVSDEGVFLTYSHYLAGISLTEIEQQHFAGYGKYYWIKCFFLVFPASLFNRVGITGIESLRLVVWIFGAIACLMLLQFARKSGFNQTKVLALYFCAFPLGAMIRYSGIKDTIVSSFLLFFFIYVGKRLPATKFEPSQMKYVLPLVFGVTSFFFIQHNFVPILCISFFLISALKRNFFLFFTSVCSILVYAALSLSFSLLSVNQVKSNEIIDVSNILSVKSVPGASLIPESIVGNIVPKSIVGNIVPEFLSPQYKDEQPSVFSTKIIHLFYVNFSSLLSAVVTFEGLVWLIVLVLLVQLLLNFRNYPTEVVLLGMFCFLAYVGILLYDENFGTFLRHRSQLTVVAIYCLIRAKNSKIHM
jgi:hypothetical protein